MRRSGERGRRDVFSMNKLVDGRSVMHNNEGETIGFF